MAKKKLDIDEILEEVSPAQKKITKIEEEKITKDVKEAVMKGDASFSKVKVFAIKDGDEYFIAEYPYENEIVKDMEAWIRKKVIPKLPKKYLTDTFKVKAFTPDNAVIFEKEVKVVIEDIEQEISTSLTEQVKEILELNKLSTQNLVNNLLALKNASGNSDEIVKEMIKLFEETIKSLKEEKERILEEVKREREKEGKSEAELIYELVKIEKTFDEKIEKLYELERKLLERKDDSTINMVMSLVTKLIEKVGEKEEKKVDPIDELTRIFSFVEKLTEKKDDKLMEKLIEIMEKKEDNDPIKERLLEIALKQLTEQKKEDTIDELKKQLEVLAQLKQIFGGDEDKEIDTITTLLMQKIEELEKKNEEILKKFFEERKEEKDELDRLIELHQKLERMKKIFGWSNPAQPVKSFMEIIMNILNSPVIENIGRIIADAMVKQEMIKQGYYIDGDRIIVLPKVPMIQGYGFGSPVPYPMIQPHPHIQQQYEMNNMYPQEYINQQAYQAYREYQEVNQNVETTNNAQSNLGNEQTVRSTEEKIQQKSSQQDELDKALDVLEKNIREVFVKIGKEIKGKNKKEEEIADMIAVEFIRKIQSPEVAEAIMTLVKYGQQHKIEEMIDRHLTERIEKEDEKKERIKRRLKKKLENM